ncbi:MAG: hypothetical protein RIT02_3220, partial [Planctomycetota bacterium]
MNSNHAGSAATLQTIGSPYYAHAAVKSTPDRFIHRGIYEKNSSKMATSKAAFSIAEKCQNSVFFATNQLSSTGVALRVLALTCGTQTCKLSAERIGQSLARTRPMPLNSWIKEASLLLAENSSRFRRRRTSRRHFAGNTTLRQYKSGDRQLRSHSESLEDRILPASLVWVGDINPLFQTDTSGNTNWDTNTLPASGDQLTFP